MDAPASAVEKNADETQSSASPTPTPPPTPPPAADTPPTPTTPPADVAANTDKVSNDAQRSEEANESNHESDSDANDAQDNHSAAPTPTKVEVSVVGENANDMKKETQDEEQDAVDTKDEKKEDMDTKKEKEEEPSDKREEEEEEEQVPPSTPDSPTTVSPVVSPPLAESAEASPTSSPTKSDPASSQQAPHFGGFPAPATAVSPGHAQAHTMQFPYASSNFVAPLPTPIRPLPGDPRLANTDGNNNSLSSPTPSLPSAPAQATVNANARMYPPQAQGFYDNNNGVNNNSNNVPVATTNGQMQSDPTSDFERQWNQSVPVPGEMGWAIAPQQPQSSDMASVDVPSQAMTQQQPNNPAAQRDPELTTTPFAAKALVPQRINDTFALEPTALSQLINYGKSLSTPGHAAAFAIDLLRASVDDESSLKAHGWHSPFQSNEYEVLLQKGSIGLCMNMSVRAGCVSVTSFRRPEGGVIGPAEASGIIQIGDDLVGVDGFPIETPEDFQNVVGRLKSLRPVLLRFRRASNVPIHSTRPDTQGYRRGLRTSIASLDNSELFTSGMWHMGVRYLAPGKWAAELHVDGGGIRRLGILPSEREAAMVYNSYIHQTYGPTAAQFMNPAGTGMGPSAAAQQGGMGLPVSMSNVRDMKPIQRPPIRRSSAKAAFTNEQKDQLRAQIMVFKYVSTGTPIEKNWLLRAVKSAAAIPMQEGADKKKRKTFAPQAVTKPLKKKAKRGAKGKKGKKKQFSDESEEESGSDDNFAAPVKEVAPTRRSGRNAGKTQKSYVQKENDSDLEYSDEEKPAAPQEPVGPKGPQIDKIIGIRFHKETADDDDVTMQFLIKWKDVSYLHLSWLTTHDIEEFGHASIMRMRRYLQKNSRDVETARENVVVGDERDFSAYFSESFLEVDRILASKDVEEPEQANPFNNHGVGDDEKPPVKQGKKYLVKWRDLSYVDCTWEWEEEITDDRKIAAFHRHNHPPIVNGAHPAMFEDIRPEPSSWAKYQESPSYNNQNVLRSYQLEGLNWLVFCWYNRRNCILADEMGLGKTVQATSILEHLRQHEHIRGPFLVIAPLATLGNWKREIETWTTMNCVVYHDSEGGADIRSFIREHEFYYPNEMYKKRGIYKFNVLVTSYQTLMADAEFLDVIPWRYVVIDEAHKLKNREAKLLQCLQNFSWDSCLLMTGTPLQNGVYELWCLLNFIEPDKFTSQQEFYDEYGELNTAEQVARLHEQLRPYMLRRVKEDVEKSIPPKEETIIDVELTTMQKKYYRAIFERNRSFLNQGSTGTVANLVNVEMELRKCCNHPFLIRGVEEKECGRGDDAHRAKTLVQASGKTVLLDKLLTKFRAENKKVLIFSQFKIMLDIIEDLCQMRNYNIERMDGSVRGNSRQAAIDRFNNLESDTFAFLLSTRAGGVGINLIAASVVILFDSDWNPQNDLQAVARCHRIGQTQSVNIYRLVTKKTYEAQMFDIASKKLGMHHAVFETGGVRNEFDGEDDGGNMMSLMSLDREKVEMMIRYGAYAIMGGDNEEEDPENRAINEVDIDQLLSSSRTIRYDPTRDNAEGTEVGEDGEPKQPTVSQSSALSFSKASFTAESSDATIDFNDEQFWEKVLGPKTVQVLMTKVQEGWLSKASKDDIKTFLTELRELARAVVQERQRGGAMEDADQVMSILIELKVTGPILKGVVNVRNVASEWQDLIERPKRRRNQDAESELMYLEFLDGTKKAPTPTNGKKKKKGAAATSNRRKSKSKQSFDTEDEVDDDDEDDEPSTPVRKPKRAKRQPSTGSAASTSSAKSGVHIVVRKKEDGDDEEYEVVRTYSTVKKTHALMFPDEAGAATPGKTALTTPKRRGRPPKKIVEEEPDDDEDDEDAEKDDDAESGGEGEDAPSEEEAEDEEEDDDDEADDDDEDEDEDTPKKSRGRRAAAKKKPAPKPRGKKGTSARKRAASVDPQVDEEMWCRVCFSDQGFMDDPIVQCERCHVAVHKYCYGIDKVPEGDTPWFCDYCGDTQQSAADATCALCPLKRSSAAFKKTRENDWVHVVCALWAPGVQFSDVERMKEVINVPEAITETRGEHCGICKEKDGCIKCFRGSCLMYFHPLCGRESKGDFDMFMNEGGQLRAFCPKHKSRSKRA